MKRYVGIDLGTTNSTISVAHLTVRGDIDSKTLEVKQVDEKGNNLTQDRTLPSVLYIDEQNNPYVGKFAKRMAGVYPKRVIREVKRYMGESVSWTMNGTDIRPEIVSSYVLKLLRAQVEEYYSGEKIKSVVITVPANFNFQQEQATRTAAVLAGFDKEQIHTIPEPTAALIDFLNEEKKLDATARRLRFDGKKKNLLVFDLGGGTCDVSILQVEERPDGGIDIQELSISQYTELGGIDFDKRVTQYLLQTKLLKNHLKMKTQEFMARYDDDVKLKLQENLLDFAEKAKTFFSTRIENQLRISNREYFDCKDEFNHLVYKEMLNDQLPEELVTLLSITKEEYDKVIEPLMYQEKAKAGQSNIEGPILNALKSAKLGEMKREDIDAVFLVGGMTFYPTIQERLFDIFDRRIKPIRTINPMHAVSRGAAVYHHMLDKIQIRSSDQLTKAEDSFIIPEVVVSNIVPNHIFIDVVGSDPVALLEKGTKLPFERLIEDKFFVTGPSDREDVNAMQLDLFTAESAKSLNMKKLKSAVINFKKPVKKNSKLVLKVVCNQEREVSVKAWLKEDETEVIDVNIGAHEFTDEEKDSIRNQLEKINQIKR